MKKIIVLSLALLCCMIAFAQQKSNDYVEVLYFHGMQRCMTCRAIEKYAKEVVYTDFAREVKAGKVRFKVVDISTAEGENIANNYRVTWSSLFVNDWKKGKENRHDLTAMGFKNARQQTDVFKKELRKQITSLLKR